MASKINAITGGDFSRVATLEGKYVRTTRFALISSGTSGTVTLPANSQVVLDDFGGTTDAVISTVSSSRPTYDPAITSGSVVVATSFDSSGNYTLTGTPSSYPVAIIYRVQQQLKDFDSTSTSIVGGPEIIANSTVDVASFLTVNTEASLAASRKVTGTANQVILTDGGALGALTLSLPQSIATSSSPSFNNLGLGGYTDFTSLGADASSSSVGIRLYSLNVTVNDVLRIVDQNGNAFTLAQDQVMSVRNTGATTIAKLAPVRFTGGFFTVSGQPIPIVAIVHATKTTFADGVMFSSMASATYGRMMKNGLISNCDTSGAPYGETWAAGDFIYLSSATDGYLTHTPPSPPALVQLVGKVFSANATTGVFFVNIQNLHGYESGTSSNSWTIGDGTTNTAKQFIMNGLIGDLTISWTPAVGSWTLTIPQSSGNDTACLTNMAQTLLSKTLSTSTVILTGGSYVKFTDATDTTKTVQFDASPLATSTNRIMTFPNRAGTILLDAYNDTATNVKALKVDSTSNATSVALTLAIAQSTSQTLNVPNITGSDTIATTGFAQTFSAANIFSVGGAASTAAVKLSGAPYSAGNATTTKPLFWIENAGTSNAWSTAGTIIGANPATGFAGNLIDLQVNAASKFKADSSGNVTAGTYNGLTVTTSTGTLTIANGKTVTVNNTLTFAGTDSTTMTFPSATDTVLARTDTATVTNKRVTLRVVTGSTGTTVTPTGDTSDIYKQTLNGHGTITMAAPTGTPVDGDFLELIIIQDATGGCTYSWNSIYVWTTDIASVATGSGANKKDRFLFQYDLGATKWCIAGRDLGQ